MKITVVCLASRTGGGLTILQDLFTFASQVDTENVWQFVISDQCLGTSTSRVEIIKTTPSYRGWRSRLRAELTVGRQAVKRFSPDFVLSLQNVDTPVRGRHPLVLYVQQALPFQTDYQLSFLKREERKLAWRQYLLKWPIIASVKRSDITFVQTNWLATSIRSLVPKNKVVPIGHAQLVSSEQVPRDSQPADHFFYPASGASYKNHRTLHSALRRLSERGEDMTNKVSVTLTTKQLIEAIGSSIESELAWYRPLGWLTPEEVHDEYSKSILVFPSLVESLGLPLYEARSLGRPVVAGNTAFGNEALGDYPAVQWFEPEDPDSLADAMFSCLETAEGRGIADWSEPEKQSPWAKMIDELKIVLRD